MRNASYFRRLISCLDLTNSKNNLPLSDDVIYSQEFADFFTMKIDTIMDNIDNQPPHSSLVDPATNALQLFTELSDQDITSLVKLTNKTCDTVPIPSSIVKSSIQILTPVLMKLINTSHKTGQVWSSCKRTLILPKLKKTKH